MTDRRRNFTFKIPIFHYTCATFHDLPSNKSAMTPFHLKQYYILSIFVLSLISGLTEVELKIKDFVRKQNIYSLNFDS